MCLVNPCQFGLAVEGSTTLRIFWPRKDLYAICGHVWICLQGPYVVWEWFAPHGAFAIATWFPKILIDPSTSCISLILTRYLIDRFLHLKCLTCWYKRNHWCLATNIHMPYAKAVHLKDQRRILWVGSYLAQDFWDNLSWIATTMHFTTLANPNTCIIYLGHSRVLLQATSWLHEPGSYMMSFEKWSW